MSEPQSAPNSPREDVPIGHSPNQQQSDDGTVESNVAATSQAEPVEDQNTVNESSSVLQPTNRINAVSYLSAAQSVTSKATTRIAVRPAIGSPLNVSHSAATNTIRRAPSRSSSRPNGTNTDSRSSSRSGSRPLAERDTFPLSDYSEKCSYCGHGTHARWNHCTQCSHRLHSPHHASQSSVAQQSLFPLPAVPHLTTAQCAPSDRPESPLSETSKGTLINNYASVDFPEDIIEETASKFGHTSYSDPVLSRQSGLKHCERQQVAAYVARSKRRPMNRRKFLQRTLPNFLPIDPPSAPLPATKSAGNSPGVPPSLPSIPEHSNTNSYPCTQQSDVRNLQRVSHSATMSEMHGSNVYNAYWSSSSNSPLSQPQRADSSHDSMYQRHIDLIERNIDRIRAMPPTPSSSNSSKPAPKRSQQTHAHIASTNSSRSPQNQWAYTDEAASGSSAGSTSSEIFPEEWHPPLPHLPAIIDEIMRQYSDHPSVALRDIRESFCSQPQHYLLRDHPALAVKYSLPDLYVLFLSIYTDQNEHPLELRPSNAIPPAITVNSGVSLQRVDTDSDVELDLELESDDETESSSSQGPEPKPLPASYWFDAPPPDYALTITASVPPLAAIDLYDSRSPEPAHQNQQPLPPIIQDVEQDAGNEANSQPTTTNLDRFAFQQPVIPRLAGQSYVDHNQGASQPRCTQISPTLSTEDAFMETVRKDGVFGDPINITELNSVLYSLLNQVTHNAFGFKKWVNGRETNRSLGESCKYGATHRKCIQKRNHLSCIHEECGVAYNAWLADPKASTERKLFEQNGNNDRLLLHVRRKHPVALRQARNLLLFYLADQDLRCTISTILAPLRKNARGTKRKLAIRPGFDDQSATLIPLQITTTATVTSQQRKAAKAEILRLWTEPVIEIETANNYYTSHCRRGHNANNEATCYLKKDGSEPRQKVILLWNRFRFSSLQRYKCLSHMEMRRLSADHPDIFIKSPDQLTIGLLRIGSTLMTPSFCRSAIKLYVANQQNIEAVRSTVIENWKQTYRDLTASNYSEQIVHAVFDELCPSINTMRIIIRTLLLVIYVRIKFLLTQLLFERTPLGFGEDQTWNRTAKLICANGESQSMGLHTVTDTLGCLVRHGFLNNHSEDHYQKVSLLTDVKALQLLYGNLDTLTSCPTVWGSDNIKSNVNLPAKIQAELAKQLESNPKYLPLKAKLAANEVDIRQLVDIADECQLHKYRRTYKALKDDSLGPKKHQDFELVTQGEIWIVNSIQYGGANLTEAVPHCGKSAHDDGKWLDVFQFEWECKEYLAQRENDQALFDLIHEYLQIDGIVSVTVRNAKLHAFKQSERWLRHKHILESWASSVHPFYRGHVLGRWINKDHAPNPNWIKQTNHFADDNNEIIKVTVDHVNQYVVDILLRLFRVNICEYMHAPMLVPTPAFLQWLYGGLISPLYHKVREPITNEHTQPIMEYSHTSKQLLLAIQDVSVTGAANSRQADLVGVWKNVNNERFHHTNRTQRRKIAPNQRVEFALIELDVEFVQFNMDKLKRVIADRPELFDDEWLRKFAAIKSELADPEALKDVARERYCLNLSHVLDEHIRSSNNMMTIRDISYKHKKFLSKQNRYNLARDLHVFKEQIRTISIDALGTFAVTYNVSIIPIIKEMQRAGLTADEFEDGRPITSPECIPKVRSMIDAGKFKRITMKLPNTLNLDRSPERQQEIQPMPIEFASAVRSPNDPYPLPSIEPSFDHHYDADSANIGDYNISLLPVFKTLTSVFKLYNEWNVDNRVLLNLVHAVNMAQYTVQDFLRALLQKDRINVVYNNIFTDKQVDAIHYWATRPHIKRLLMGMIDTTSRKMQHLSYQRRHATESNPECVAMNVLGNDATKNAKYSSANKKRRLTDVEDCSVGQEPPKKKTRRNNNTKKEWRSIFKMNTNEIRLKATLKECDCKFEEVSIAKRESPGQKFKAWANPDACLADIKKQTITSLRRGGAVKMKHFASLHGWKKNTCFGNVKEYAMDFIIMHCVYGLTAEEFHAKKRVDIFNQYERDWNGKKPINGKW